MALTRGGEREQRLAEMPCEYAAREIIPSIRAALAIVMVEMGASKYRVATLLGLTPAAVTNYVSGKRGSKYLSELLSRSEMRRALEKAGRILLSDASLREKQAIFKAIICYLCSLLNRYECEAPYAREYEKLFSPNSN